MKSAAQDICEPPDGTASDEAFDQYVAFIETQCRLATDFIDETFGEGVCDQLLGPKTSLEKLLDLCDEIGRAVEQQGSQLETKLTRYKPNRTTAKGEGMNLLLETGLPEELGGVAIYPDFEI